MIPASGRPPRQGTWWLRLVPAILYAALIYYLSSIHGNSIPSLGVKVSDKLIHVLEYFVLGYLVIWGLHIDRSKPLGHKRILLAIAAAICYGALDEIHQYFVPGRSAETLDWIADSCGILLALAVYQVLFRLQQRSNRQSSLSG